jgi:hypothetical protein
MMQRIILRHLDPCWRPAFLPFGAPFDFLADLVVSRINMHAINYPLDFADRKPWPYVPNFSLSVFERHCSFLSIFQVTHDCARRNRRKV